MSKEQTAQDVRAQIYRSFDLHEQKVKDYIINNYPDWDIERHLSTGNNVDICENGDVHYDGYIIIKTNIRLDN